MWRICFSVVVTCPAGTSFLSGLWPSTPAAHCCILHEPSGTTSHLLALRATFVQFWGSVTVPLATLGQESHEVSWAHWCGHSIQPCNLFLHQWACVALHCPETSSAPPGDGSSRNIPQGVRAQGPFTGILQHPLSPAALSHSEAYFLLMFSLIIVSGCSVHTFPIFQVGWIFFFPPETIKNHNRCSINY